MLGQECDVLRRKVGTIMDAERVHSCRGLGSDAVKAFDRQAGDKGCALVRRDDADPVGLVLVRRHLGDELAIAHPGRGGEARFGLDARADRLGDRRRGADPGLVRSEVEIRLVEA